MTREEMVKRSWKPFTVILYKPPRAEAAVECLLVGILFDDEILILQPMGDDYMKDDIHVSLKYCSIAPKKMTVVK